MAINATTPVRHDNRATKEFSGQTAARATMDARQAAKLANNQSIAAQHRAPGGGPQPGSSTETQPQPVRPTVANT